MVVHLRVSSEGQTVPFHFAGYARLPVDGTRLARQVTAGTDVEVKDRITRWATKRSGRNKFGGFGRDGQRTHDLLPL